MPATAEKTQEHKFYSRGRNERLIRQPLTMLQTAMGPQIKQQDRVDYDFAPDGRLTLRAGQDRRQDGPPDPETGELTWQDAVTWLTAGYKDQHGDYGPHPQLNVRVWHEGHEPDRPLPTEPDFMAIITDAAVELAEEPIVVALETERGSHNRPALVQAAERALEQVRAMSAKIAAQNPPPPV